MTDFAVRITQRLHAEFVPERAAVLAVIAQDRLAHFAGGDRLAQPMPFILLAVLALQNAQVAADQILGKITSQRLKTRIDINDRMVRVLHVDQRDRLRRGIDQIAQ